jgi:hypothetical protein
MLARPHRRPLCGLATNVLPGSVSPVSIPLSHDLLDYGGVRFE